MKAIVKYFALFLLVFAGHSCVSELDMSFSNDTDMLIVEGNIISNTMCEISLGKSFSLNEVTVPLSSLDVVAEVVAVGSDGYRSNAAIYLGSGKYSLSVGDLDENQKYGLEITYNENIYLSELLPPLKTPEIDSVSWVQNGAGGPISLTVSAHGVNNEPIFCLWNYVEDWEIESPYITSVFYDPKTQSYYSKDSLSYRYCWRGNDANPFLIGSSEFSVENKIVNQQLYSQDVRSDRYSVLYSVNVIQKALTKAAYEYYTNKEKLNNDMGGLFTPQPSEVPGNILCRTNSSKLVMGYVNVLKSVSEKRIYIEPKEITRWGSSSNCNEIAGEDLSSYLRQYNLSLPQFYSIGFRPVGSADPFTVDLWVSATCVDCTRNGGSKNKPSFWPNDHE